jgi:ubiquinone biosynthesis protein
MKEFAEEGLRALKAIARMAEEGAARPVVVAPARESSGLTWLAAGALIAGLAFVLARLLG